MSRTAKEALGWGFTLWLIGYMLGIALIAIVGPSMVGWVILPIGIAITVWVLLRRVRSVGRLQFLVLGAVWTTIAIAMDYICIVKAFHPADGYYKLDVYLYYLLTFLLPLAVGWWKAVDRPEAIRAAT